MATTKADKFLAAFIEEIGRALREARDTGLDPPIERRKLRTILTECRRRGSPRALEEIDRGLTQAGIYTAPRLPDDGLRLNDWVWFSTGPIPPDSAFFPREADLQKFVQACLGSGPFRNLEAARAEGGRSGREFRLPDGRRIDLLCEERRKSGTGALVVIEFKRKHERGTVEQVMEYIDALRQRHPTRAVRGLIVSGREDRVASARLHDVTGYDIRWLCYEVAFREVSATEREEPESVSGHSPPGGVG